MKARKQRYYLQIRFHDNNDHFLFRTWDINEPFKSLSECKRMAESMLDETVSKMRIADSRNNNVYKQYR